MELAFTFRPQAASDLLRNGFALLSAAEVAAMAGCTSLQLHALDNSWDRLSLDTHLKDGGKYRRRRHSSFVAEVGRVAQVPHRAHWQPREVNALHGDIRRWFAPLEDDVANSPALVGLMQSLADFCSSVWGFRRWFIEAHQFRIETEGGLGLPTPEGAHRDGVDLVGVFLVSRQHIAGGESCVQEAHGRSANQRFTLTTPWSVLLLDDARMVHETSAIRPSGGSHGYRDTLVLTFRANEFLGG